MTTCHICSLPIPDNVVSYKHPLYPTIDHVIPKSRGGPSHYSNYAPAHRICNGIKADKYLNKEIQETCRIAVKQHVSNRKTSKASWCCYALKRFGIWQWHVAKYGGKQSRPYPSWEIAMESIANRMREEKRGSTFKIGDIFK